MAKAKNERRKHPRAEAAVGLTLGAEPHLSGVQVRNISSSGLGFRINQPIEFMTRLMMSLVFPASSNLAAEPGTPPTINCEGAVVRCDAVSEKEYEVAVFFVHMDDTAKKAIEEYVKMHV